jgi:methyl-accepting chemotaxis protein-1 (serine sensor receptor)
MIDEVERTLKHANAIHVETDARNLAQYQQTRLMLLIAMALTMLAGGIITWWLVRSITHPLAQAVTVARTVASGDLQTTLVSPGATRQPN